MLPMMATDSLTPRSSLIPHRTLVFWVLHAMGWGGYAMSHYLGAVLHEKPSAYRIVILTAALAGFVVSAPLRWVCRAMWKQPPAVLVPVTLTAAYGAALIWRLIVNHAYRVFYPHDMEWYVWTDYFSGAMSGMYMMTCWVGLYFGFRYYEAVQLQREAALRATALAQEAQLKMLRYQLNPHFLFNTLNAISTLILDNRNAVANSAVSGLSDFLRYTLDQDPMKKVTVAQEIEVLNLYLDIEKMRFGRRLTIDYQIEPDAREALMPSLLLQPLIENAIKYAVSPREEGGTIRIVAAVRDDTLHLRVSDDGPGIVDRTRIDNGRGVGLKNTRERLHVLYGERGVVSIEDAAPGLTIHVQLPFERTEP
jgi:two-component system LytT family sensor kinase